MLSRKFGREIYNWYQGCFFIDSLACRYFSSYRAAKPVNHYTVLGLTPKATQGEIKFVTSTSRKFDSLFILLYK